MKNEIIVFTSKDCEHCKALKNMFKEKEIKFTEKPVENNKDEWVKITRLTGMGIFPTTIIDSEYLIPGRDYLQQEQLVAYIDLLKEMEDSFSYELRMKESFKTLTYSINQGFMRIFQEIEQLKKEKDDE